MMARGLKGVLATFVLAAATASAEPTHYVVFGFDAAGRVEPRFHAMVERATDVASAIAPSALPAGAVSWRVVKDGQRGDRRDVEVSRVLRAEYAHDVVGGEGEIDAHATSDPDPSFVLRVPVREADAIEIETAAGTQHIDLAALVAAADRLPPAHRWLAPTASRSPSHRLRRHPRCARSNCARPTPRRSSTRRWRTG